MKSWIGRAFTGAPQIGIDSSRANLTTDFLGMQIPVTQLEQMKQLNFTAIGKTVNDFDVDVLGAELDEFIYETVDVAGTDRLEKDFKTWIRSLFFAQKDGFEDAVTEFDGDFNMEAAVENALEPIMRHARSSTLDMYSYDVFEGMYGDPLVYESSSDSPGEPAFDLNSTLDEPDASDVEEPPLDVNSTLPDADVELPDEVLTTAVSTTASSEADYGALAMYGEPSASIDMYGNPVAESRTRRAPQRVQVEFVNLAHSPAPPLARVPPSHVVPPPHILRPGGAYPFTW